MSLDCDFSPIFPERRIGRPMGAARRREIATRRWMRNLIAQLMEHLPDPTVLASASLDRILCANSEATAWLLPVVTGGRSGMDDAIRLHPSVRTLSREEPELLPIRAFAVIGDQPIKCRIQLIHTGIQREPLRLLSWEG
ncbi:hypothetical protein [Thalassobaculum sp.]|uniref:hypothetical protein n=1 Tax=Thalassobaculum sp. TaxID=2022740 RepID=UPI0032ED38C8